MQGLPPVVIPGATTTTTTAVAATTPATQTTTVQGDPAAAATTQPQAAAAPAAQVTTDSTPAQAAPAAANNNNNNAGTATATTADTRNAQAAAADTNAATAAQDNSQGESGLPFAKNRYHQKNKKTVPKQQRESRLIYIFTRDSCRYSGSGAGVPSSSITIPSIDTAGGRNCHDDGRRRRNFYFIRNRSSRIFIVGCFLCHHCFGFKDERTYYQLIDDDEFTGSDDDSGGRDYYKCKFNPDCCIGSFECIIVVESYLDWSDRWRSDWSFGRRRRNNSNYRDEAQSEKGETVPCGRRYVRFVLTYIIVLYQTGSR